MCDDRVASKAALIMERASGGGGGPVEAKKGPEEPD
jgi:hypothetical protein